MPLEQRTEARLPAERQAGSNESSQILLSPIHFGGDSSSNICASASTWGELVRTPLLRRERLASLRRPLA
jgi:hypothetical protein